MKVRMFFTRRLAATGLLLSVSSSHPSCNFIPTACAFPLSTATVRRAQSSFAYTHHTRIVLSSSSYTPPEADSSPEATQTKPQGLFPKVGDIVRYYDLDGGRQQGQELVGKLTFIQKSTSSPSGWLAEITQLEDVRDGYYAEYSSGKRMGKKTDRDLAAVSPIMASYVRAEQAYKVPLTEGRPAVRQETYDLQDWEGPQAIQINKDVVEQDGILYGQLKFNLLKNAALTGAVGTILVNFVKGQEDAAIYLAGVLGSLGYLFFLSVKTDTLASPDRKLGNNVSNLRFFMPVFVIVGVALYNQSRGELNPLKDSGNPLDTVTPEQFASAVLGFLTYRLPLFVGQLKDAFKDDDSGAMVLPGSAGVVMKMAQKQQNNKTTTASSTIDSSGDDLVTVLLVSGPQATGRSELVQALLSQDERFVAPRLVDKLQDGVTFERFLGRGDFLQIDPTGRFGLTKDSVLTSADRSKGEVVAVDANVDLAKSLQTVAGARLIGVWVGLNSVQEFEKRLLADMEAGKIDISPDETKESVLRARIKEIVTEIEFGLSSGIFEFTILNEDLGQGLTELKAASQYAFKL